MAHGPEELLKRMGRLNDPKVRLQIADAMAQTGQAPPGEAEIEELLRKFGPQRQALPAPTDPAPASNPFENLPRNR